MKIDFIKSLAFKIPIVFMSLVVGGYFGFRLHTSIEFIPGIGNILSGIFGQIVLILGIAFIFAIVTWLLLLVFTIGSDFEKLQVRISLITGIVSTIGMITVILGIFTTVDQINNQTLQTKNQTEQIKLQTNALEIDAYLKFSEMDKQNEIERRALHDSLKAYCDSLGKPETDKKHINLAERQGQLYERLAKTYDGIARFYLTTDNLKVKSLLWSIHFEPYNQELIQLGKYLDFSYKKDKYRSLIILSDSLKKGDRR